MIDEKLRPGLKFVAIQHVQQDTERFGATEVPSACWDSPQRMKDVLVRIWMKKDSHWQQTFRFCKEHCYRQIWIRQWHGPPRRTTLSVCHWAETYLGGVDKMATVSTVSNMWGTDPIVAIGWTSARGWWLIFLIISSTICHSNESHVLFQVRGRYRHRATILCQHPFGMRSIQRKTLLCMFINDWDADTTTTAALMLAS